MSATLFTNLPVGTTHLADFCARTEQAVLRDLARSLVREYPLMQPITKNGFPLSLRVTSWGRCGWFGSEGRYEYLTRHANGQPFPPIPAFIHDAMMRAALAKRGER